MFIRQTLIVLTSTAMLSACGAWQTVSDASSSAYHTVFFKQVKFLNIDLSARDALNADDAGRPTSVAVSVYQLKDRKLFDKASYDDLLKNDHTVLAQDLQDNMAAVLNPGASASLSQPMQADTKYVAIVALYQEPWQRLAICHREKEARRRQAAEAQTDRPDPACRRRIWHEVGSITVLTRRSTSCTCCTCGVLVQCRARSSPTSSAATRPRKLTSRN